MDFLAPSSGIQTITAIISGEKEELQSLKRRGQLAPLETMITFFQDSDWQTTMPILMFIIYDSLKERSGRMNRGIIYRTLPVFLEGLSEQEISGLLNREYTIKGCPPPLANEDEYSSDKQCTIQTTPLSWLIYLCTKNRLHESLSESSCLNALSGGYKADINQPFVFHYTGGGEEDRWTQVSGRSILYAAFAFNKISWAVRLVREMARFSDNDRYPFFDAFKRSEKKNRFHVVECFWNMLQQGTVTRERIACRDPASDRTDSPFFLMVKDPCISSDDNQYIITHLMLLGFNPLLTLINWTLEESNNVGLQPPKAFATITPRELAVEIHNSITEYKKQMLMGRLITALQTAETLCTQLRGNTVAIYQALTTQGLPPELQRHILSGLPYEKYLGNIPKAEAAVSAVYDRRKKAQSEPVLSTF